MIDRFDFFPRIDGPRPLVYVGSLGGSTARCTDESTCLDTTPLKASTPRFRTARFLRARMLVGGLGCLLLCTLSVEATPAIPAATSPDTATLETAASETAVPDTAVSLDAAISHFRTRRISAVDGLVQSSVYALLQDRQGFVWLGCQDGLQRYDGYRFEAYKPDPFNTESLSHGMVQSLLEDASGDLWVGTFGGLDQLSMEGDRFIGHGPNEGGRWNISALVEDDRGFLWVGTVGTGLVQIPPDRQSQKHFWYPQPPRVAQ